MCDAITLKDWIYCLVDIYIVMGLIPILVGLALVMFLWGVFKFVRDAGDEKARTEGKKLMLWGIFGLFIMFSVWAIVGLLTSLLSGGQPFIPQI